MIKKHKEYFLDNLTRIKNKKIIVIGDVMLDEYIWGSVERISPEAPVPVVKVEKSSKTPGGAANVVNNLIGLNASVYLFGVIGNDTSGKFLKKYFTKQKVDISGLLVDENRNTSLKTRIVAHNQQVVRVDREDTFPISKKITNLILKNFRKLIDSVDGVLISDYGKGVIIPDLIEPIIEISNRKRKVIVVDPKVEHFFYYKNVTLITPNHLEAGESLNLKLRTEEDCKKAGLKILKKLNLKSLFITRSKDGMMVFERGKQPKNIPTNAKKVYDVTGAGDTIVSTAIIAIVSGFNFEEAAVLSNYAAGIVVGEVGTTVITFDKLQNALKNE